MDDVRIINSNLKKSNLDFSSFNHAILIKVNLDGSSISAAHLNGTQLKSVNLDNTRSLNQVFFEGAFLLHASLKNANLSSLYLKNAEILKSDLSDLTTTSSQLSGAYFYDVILTNTSFQHSHGKNTRFFNSPLDDVNLKESKLINFTINSTEYNSRFDNIERVAKDLADLNPYYRIETPPPVRTTLLEAIKNRDNDLILQIKEEHCSLLGDHTPIDLQASNLSHHDLSGLDLSGIDFSGSNFSQTKAISTNFLNSKLNGLIIAPLNNSDKLDYTDVKLDNASMKNCLVTNVLLESAQANKSDFGYTKFECINVNNSSLNNSMFEFTKFCKDSIIINSSFNDSILINAIINQTKISCDFKNTELSSTSFLDSDLSGSKLQAKLVSTKINSCNLTDTNFEGGSLLKTHIVDCNAKRINLNSVGIYNCYINRTDMEKATLDKTYFKTSQIKNSNLDHVDVKTTLFIDSFLKEIKTDLIKNITQDLNSALGSISESKKKTLEEYKKSLVTPDIAISTEHKKPTNPSFSM